MEATRTKCLIVGSGPAGYTAAIYASRAGLEPVLYEGYEPGGQLTTTTEVENYPGFPEGVQGTDLMEVLRKQAVRLGTDIRFGVVSGIDFSQRPFHAVAADGTDVMADTVIICTGATARYLGLADEEKFKGMGVSACATCDGFFYRGRKVAVVGGGDTACEEALYLSNIAEEVYLIVRRDRLRASKVMQQRVMAKENIKVLFNTVTEGLYGSDVLEGARLVEKGADGAERHYELPLEGFFLAIGRNPNTDLVKGVIELDENGYIKTVGDTTATNVEGVFAAGDVADPRYQQAIVAAGSGAKAALDADEFLMLHQ
ncbi:MAG: thioredoxin-disulfide reductase [Candidatus Amulumruptor caecigallinarius]|nr:thioredoxin-disulfide reductase [Candidatus Amulumruptor caecigallinarius]MCM1396317.1 thioredoxin-disulfide reductase [Candidatus Amulumruptor caecigallinarius]MCM1453741.1 thioredoxin-disulfide reductase [bacterium]